MNIWILPCICIGISSEQSHIRHSSTVNRHRMIHLILRVILVNLLLTFFDVIAQNLNLLKRLDFLLIQIPNRRSFTLCGAFNTTSTSFMDFPVEYKPITQQSLRGNVNDRFIPITYPTVIKVELQANSINTVLWDFDSVPLTYRIICRSLNTRDNP